MGDPVRPVSEARGTVLFVDDDQRLLEMIEPLMGRLSGGAWRVITATNAGQALRLLQEHEVHLVVIDLRMPVMDGLQFLTIINRRYPNLHKAVMTGHATEAYRTACLTHGAELFLEKPRNPDEWEGLYASLNELMRWKPAEGFQGVLKKVSLEDVLQMECLGRSSSILEVSGHRAKGRIYIRDGSLVHAVYQSLEGDSALHQMLRLSGGTFHLLPFEDPGRTTLEGSWESLLMEAARMRDEVNSAAGTTLLSGPAVASSETGPAARPSMAVSSASRGADQAGVITHDARPDAAPEGPAPSVLRPVVDQVLICSARGEPLYEWRVKNSDFWIHFLEFVSRKARQISQELALGAFRRIMIENASERITAILLADQVALIRAHFKDPADPSGATPSVAAPGSPPLGHPASAASIPPGFAEEIVRWLNGLPDHAGLLAAGVWFSRETLGTRNWSDSLPDEVVNRVWRHPAEVIHVLNTHRLPSVTVTWRYERGTLRSSVRDDRLGLGLLTSGDTTPGSPNPAETLTRAFLK